MGEDPDYSKGQLWEAIEAGKETDHEKLGFDPFDVAKLWPRGHFLMHVFGRLVLKKEPVKLCPGQVAWGSAGTSHRDVEQAASSPGSMVPGVGDSGPVAAIARMS